LRLAVCLFDDEKPAKAQEAAAFPVAVQANRQSPNFGSNHMVFIPPEYAQRPGALSASAHRNILHGLIPIGSGAARALIGPFAIRLTEALFEFSGGSRDARKADLCFNAANRLKKNAHAFNRLATANLEDALRRELYATEHLSRFMTLDKVEEGLSLVSYEEMDGKMMLGKMSRPIEQANAEQFIALGRRLSVLLERSELSMAQNPFRPEVFLSAIDTAWREFDPEAESRRLILPLLKPEVFLDLAPVLAAVNDELVAHGVLPELGGYQIKKTIDGQDATSRKKDSEAAIAQRLRHLLAGTGDDGSAGRNVNSDLQENLRQASVASKQLLGYLSRVQKNIFSQPVTGSTTGNHQGPALWGNIKRLAPGGAITRVDENTIDLLSKIFDVVFHDQNIPGDIKDLISLLQVPILKAALVDKDFFFSEDHPARRLIEALSKFGVALDQTKGLHDPLYQKMKRVVERVQGEFDTQVSVFSDVVTDLETFIDEEEAVAATAIAAPITMALRQEKVIHATRTAKVEVSHRVGTGEVVAFLETFLEARWVPVLTIAYSMEEEKPEVVQFAINTMDDLIWSVKPKLSLDERKELISRLPALLGSLNKWLNIIKWNDADRQQFFAELAECHASLVRAPLPMSAERRLEIAMEVAKEAAERRLAKRANAQPEPVADKYDVEVTGLERGMWLDYQTSSGGIKRVKLAWVSPMRSLYIFTTREKNESFSVSSEELAQCFRTKRARTVLLGGLVDRALVQALGTVGANDADIDAASAA
jgi:hypothetical protein